MPEESTRIALLQTGAADIARISLVSIDQVEDDFDLYLGRGVPERHRSLAYRLRFQSPDRTLTDLEVDRAVERAIDRLRVELGVERRA